MPKCGDPNYNGPSPYNITFKSSEEMRKWCVARRKFLETYDGEWGRMDAVASVFYLDDNA